MAVTGNLHGEETLATPPRGRQQKLVELPPLGSQSWRAGCPCCGGHAERKGKSAATVVLLCCRDGNSSGPTSLKKLQSEPDRA